MYKLAGWQSHVAGPGSTCQMLSRWTVCRERLEALRTLEGMAVGGQLAGAPEAQMVQLLDSMTVGACTWYLTSLHGMVVLYMATHGLVLASTDMIPHNC